VTATHPRLGRGLLAAGGLTVFAVLPFPLPLALVRVLPDLLLFEAVDRLVAPPFLSFGFAGLRLPFSSPLLVEVVCLRKFLPIEEGSDGPFEVRGTPDGSPNQQKNQPLSTIALGWFGFLRRFEYGWSVETEPVMRFGHLAVNVPVFTGAPRSAESLTPYSKEIPCVKGFLRFPPGVTPHREELIILLDSLGAKVTSSRHYLGSIEKAG